MSVDDKIIFGVDDTSLLMKIVGETINVYDHGRYVAEKSFLWQLTFLPSKTYDRGSMEKHKIDEI